MLQVTLAEISMALQKARHYIAKSQTFVDQQDYEVASQQFRSAVDVLAATPENFGNSVELAAARLQLVKSASAHEHSCNAKRDVCESFSVTCNWVQGLGQEGSLAGMICNVLCVCKVRLPPDTLDPASVPFWRAFLICKPSQPPESHPRAWLRCQIAEGRAGPESPPHCACAAAPHVAAHVCG